MNIEEKLHYAEVLEKVAAVIEDLENREAKLQAKISTLDGTLEQVKLASYNDVVENLVVKGFSEEEAAKMVNALPGETLDKVASLVGNPTNNWQLGSVSDAPGKSGDPMLDFIFS